MDAEKFFTRWWIYSSVIPKVFCICVFVFFVCITIIVCLSNMLALTITICFFSVLAVLSSACLRHSRKFYAKYPKSILVVQREMLYADLDEIDRSIGDSDEDDDVDETI